MRQHCGSLAAMQMGARQHLQAGRNKLPLSPLPPPPPPHPPPPRLPAPAAVPAGRDLHGALELMAAGKVKERLFGWQRRGRRVAYDVAKALNYLHSKGVVHMDVVSPEP